MAKLTPIPTAQRPSDGGYQPVSWLAVSAIFVTGLFVLVMIALFINAWTSRKAVLAYEWLVFPVVGLGFAIAAGSHVRRSEGTRSGAKLASLSWWVCVLGGAGFFAYLMANEYFIGVESRNFADRFFEQLKNDKPYHAFTFFIDPAQRENANPDNAEGMEAQFGQMYGAFRNLDVVREFRRSAGSIKIEHAGSTDVAQEADGYKATHIYRMETPEGLFEVRVGLKATESRIGGKPQWKIVSRPNFAFTIKPEKLSQYGRLINDLEAQEIRGLVSFWTDPRVQRVPFRAHLFTFPGIDREKMEQSLSRLTVFGGGIGGIWPVTSGILPADRRKSREVAEASRMAVSGGAILTQTESWVAFEDLFEIGFFKRFDENAPFTPELLTKLRLLWRAPSLTPANLERPLPPNISPAEAIRMTIDDKQIKYLVPIDWQTSDLKSFYKATLTIVCEEPEVIQMLQESRKKGLSAPDNGQVTLRDLPPRRWRIAQLQTDLELIAPPSPNMGTSKGP